jgi:repressor LexA
MLTERQDGILEYIRSYQERERVPPSSRLVQRHFGFLSQTTAVRHLRTLAAKGLLEQLADGRWGVIATNIQGHFVEVPVYGSIPAGAPAFTEQQVAEILRIDLRMLGTKGRVWAVRVEGDSMIGAHIAEGDIAILEKREPQPGEIIAALVDETSTTLKSFIIEGGRPVLRAANAKYADIFPSTLECQGVLVGLFRVASHRVMR